MLSVITLSVEFFIVMIHVIMLSVIMLNVVILGVSYAGCRGAQKWLRGGGGGVDATTFSVMIVSIMTLRISVTFSISIECHYAERRIFLYC